MQMSFMRESRRIGNRRLKKELKLRLAYPTVDDGIADALKGETACLSSKRSTFRLVVAWFAGLFYLPRIFVNLAMVPADSVAERERLLLMAASSSVS
jgi:putative membrane protein